MQTAKDRSYKPDNAPVCVPFECKALPTVEDPDFFYFEGYGSTWGNIDRYDDVIVKGCFDESLKELTPDLRWQHNFDDIIGVFVDIRTDDRGLFVKGKMPKADTLVAGRVIPQMKVGSVRSMSIGFRVKEFDYDEEGIRIIKRANLYEISLVSQPVNPKASVTDMKKFELGDVEKVRTRREYKDLLRDSGAFSRKSIVYLASRFQEAGPSDSAAPEDTAELVRELKQFAKKLKTL